MLTNNYKPFIGGVPVSVERQAKALRSLGHQVTVFAPDYGECIDDADEDEVVRCECFKKKMINGMVYPKPADRKVRDIFRREPFDCIHVHQPVFAGNTALWLKRKYGIPVVYTWHTKYEDYLHYFPLFRNEEKAGGLRRLLIKAGRQLILPAYMRWFTGQCDLVLAPTKGMKMRILKTGVKTPVEVLPTGLEEEFFAEDKKTAGKIRKEHLADRKYLFCTVSRLEKEKNLMFLLEGIRRLKEEDMDPFRLLVIGEGSQRAYLENVVKEWKLEDCVTFTGNMPNGDLKNYLAASDLFLFSSKSETQGIVIQEALACGCPVVAVKASGVEDAVEDGKNGYLTPEDVDQWCLKVWKAVEGPGREKMRACAKRSVRGYRSILLAMQEERMYQNCLEQKRKEVEEHEGEPAAVSFSGLFKIT